MFFIQLLISQNYLWPTNSSRTPTGTFGDVRSRRYHSGIDIRTYGRNGFEVYAIEDGYIARIRTSSKGYGKALYLKLSDGNTAVYAHLERFTTKMDSVAKALQKARGSYTIHHYFKENEYPVKSGELIGYTGDTGSIGGPHLHFEIRDPNARPVNPLTTNLSISDTQFPIAKNIAVIPLDKSTVIDGQQVPQLYSVDAINQNEYVLNDTIKVFGQFGLAVEVYDKINQQPFNFGVYGLNLQIDSQPEYQIQFDNYDWPENPLVYHERDYRLFRKDQGKFHHLYSSRHTKKLSFIKNDSKEGLLLSLGFHNFLIEAWDINMNKITISGIIESFANQSEIPFSFENIEISDDKDSSMTVDHYEHGIIFSFKFSDSPDSVKIGKKWHKLSRIGSGNYTSPVLDPQEISGDQIIVKWNNELDAAHQVKFWITGKPVSPGQSFICTSDDEMIKIAGNSDTFYYPTFIRIEKLDQINCEKGTLWTEPYLVEPRYIPFKNKLGVEFNIKNEIDEHSGIFYFDDNDRKWIYLKTDKTDQGTLKTSILSGEILAVISESTPPIIQELVPKIGKTYRQDQLKEISFQIDDKFSGIDVEENVIIKLDDVTLLFEYNSYRKTCFYEFEKPLSIGDHKIYIQATDNLGNIREVVSTFYIK